MADIKLQYESHYSWLDDDIKISVFTFLSPKLFDLLTGNDFTIQEIEFGEYPQSYIDSEYEKELEKEFKTNKSAFKPTGRTFTFINNNVKYKRILTIMQPAHQDIVKNHKNTYIEYEYNNKKYIRIERKDYTYWREVTPIIWKVDHESKKITTKEKIANAVLKNIDSRNQPYLLAKRKDVVEDISETSIYVESIILKDILQTVNIQKTIKYKDYSDLVDILSKNDNFDELKKIVELVLDGPPLTPKEKETINTMLEGHKITYNEIQLIESEESKKVNDIIKEINLLLDLGLYDNKDEIKKQVYKLINDYNENIKKTNKDEIVLSLDNHDISYLYNELIINLEDIMNKLLLNKKYNEHIKMLKLVHNCISILDDDPKAKITDDIELEILQIRNEIFPLLKNSHKPEELKNMLKNEKERIIAFIKGNNTSDAKNYNNLDNFKTIFIRKLQTFIISINSEIIKQQTVKEIQEKYKNIILGQKIESKDKQINLLLKEIHENVLIIKEKGTEEEKASIIKIIEAAKILENDDYQNTLSKLNFLFNEAYKIVYTIKQEEEHNKEIEKYTITVK